MNLTKTMWGWLASAGADGILPRNFPSGWPVSARTIRRLEFSAGYIRERAYGANRWCVITDAGRAALATQ